LARKWIVLSCPKPPLPSVARELKRIRVGYEGNKSKASSVPFNLPAWRGFTEQDLRKYLSLTSLPKPEGLPELQSPILKMELFSDTSIVTEKKD